MACSVSETKIKGFFLQTIEANLTVGITDVFGDPQIGAKVTIDNGFDTDMELADRDGIVKFNLAPDLVAHLKVEKDLYHVYESDIIAVAMEGLGTTINFPFLLRSNHSTDLVNSATATLSYWLKKKNELGEEVEEEIYNMDVIPNGDKVYEGIFKYGYINKLQVTDSGHGTFEMAMDTFLNIEITNTGYTVVPILQLI